MGLKIAFGTDAGVYPHGNNAKEFGDQVELGQTPIAAIRSASVVAAELLGVDDRGRLEPGLLADVTAVRGNPLEDIRELERVTFVIKGGQVRTARAQNDDTGHSREKDAGRAVSCRAV